MTGRMRLAGSYEVTYVACSTVVLWWPADGRSTGPEKGTRKARKILGQAVPSTG